MPVRGGYRNLNERYRTQNLTIYGEKLSADINAAEPFRQRFLDKLQEVDMVPDQVYNSDESLARKIRKNSI